MPPLSERWQRVAIQQAAGIARSWRTNRTQAYQDYTDDLLAYHELEVGGTLTEGSQEPAGNAAKRGVAAIRVKSA